jgi:hypothetical protein
MRGARRQVALQAKSEKYCAQTSQSFVALQSGPVKNPVSAFSHNQDPNPTFGRKGIQATVNVTLNDHMAASSRKSVHYARCRDMNRASPITDAIFVASLRCHTKAHLLHTPRTQLHSAVVVNLAF